MGGHFEESASRRGGECGGFFQAIKGRSGETYDAGRIALYHTVKRLDGRVVGSDGQPVSDAVVFSNGDGRETASTLTDSQGQFHLEALAAGTKHVFIRKNGYRFTGVRLADDAETVAVTTLKKSEPAPDWKPATGASFDQQRTFAKRMLASRGFRLASGRPCPA
jgi:hypothetical protein